MILTFISPTLITNIKHHLSFFLSLNLNNIKFNLKNYTKVFNNLISHIFWFIVRVFLSTEQNYGDVFASGSGSARVTRYYRQCLATNTLTNITDNLTNTTSF